MNIFTDLLNPSDLQSKTSLRAEVDWVFEGRPKVSPRINSNVEINREKHQLEDVISIFRDKHGQVGVGKKEPINKDILHYFVIPKSSLLSNLSNGISPNVAEERLKQHVYIDENIFYRGNRKKDQKPKTSTSIILSGSVKCDGNDITLCRTCIANGNFNLLVRNCEETPTGDLRVTASIKCGGEPVGGDRLLTVSFNLQTQGVTFWSGSAPSIKLLHHRRKLVPGEEEPTPRSSKQRKTCESEVSPTPIVDIPIEEFWPEVASLSRHIYKEAESSKLEMDATLELQAAQHETMRIFNHILNVIRKIPENFTQSAKALWTPPQGEDRSTNLMRLTAAPIIQQQITEYLVNAVAFLHLTIDGLILRSIEPSYIESTRKAVISRAVAIHDDMASKQYGTPFQDLSNIIHQDILWNLQRVDSILCTCDTCVSVHLSWIISYAKQKGATATQLEESLTKLKIIGSQGIHPKLTFSDLSSRKGRIGLSLYFSSISIGTFSRIWLPKRRFVDDLNDVLDATVDLFPIRMHSAMIRSRLDDFCANKERENLVWDKLFLNQIK